MDEQEQGTSKFTIRARYLDKDMNRGFLLGHANGTELSDIKVSDGAETKEYNIVEFKVPHTFEHQGESYKSSKIIKTIYIGFDVISIDEVPAYLQELEYDDDIILDMIEEMKEVGTKFCVKLPVHPDVRALLENSEVVDKDLKQVWPKPKGLKS